MKVSSNGFDIIKQFEGLRLKPYLCPAGKPTIGYGSTFYEDGTKVTLNDNPITKERADELLEFIVNKKFVPYIDKLVKVPLSQNQFDALVSFIYNIGNENFRTSTLLAFLNKKNYKESARQLLRWDKSNKKVLSGLKERRKVEKELFEKV